MAQRVFISYASSDRVVAEAVRSRLVRSHFDVWIDTRRLQVGDPLEQEILDKIQPNTAFVLLHSRASSTSDWVQRELATALASRSREAGGIFVVRLDDTPMRPKLVDAKFADWREQGSGDIEVLVRGIWKWAQKSHIYATPLEGLSSRSLILLPSLMAPFMALFVHMFLVSLSILPMLTLHTRKIPLGAYFLTIIYGMAAGPALATCARFASLRGALRSTGFSSEILARLYQQQQNKLLFFFSWMGFWLPPLLELGLQLITADEHNLAALVVGFIVPFFMAGIGTVVLSWRPGPNPLLP